MDQTERKRTLIIFLVYWLFFLYFQSTSLYGGDAGDLVSASLTGSTAHPPGYPLYSFLGWLVSHIPLSTYAWRVSLISSLASAGALTLLTHLINKITHNRVASLLASSILAMTYVFWLYAVVPEVFGLFSFFIALLIYQGYRFSTHPSLHRLYVLACTAGLAMTHHHMIVFIFPSIAVCLFQQRHFLARISLKQWIGVVICGCIGLSAYMWAIIAGLRVAPIIWDDPVTPAHLYRLISRADYGSFQSGIVYGEHIKSRLLQFIALFDYYIQDFTSIGCWLAIIGGYGMFKKARRIFWIIATGWICTGPGYFFYASYLYSTRFHIATAERFVIPSYLFMTVFIGYGIQTLITSLEALPDKTAHMNSLIRNSIYALIAIIPISLFIINYPKISILKYDRTAEKFAEDILRDLEPNSILLLQGDHPVFNTQYLYYGFGYRRDVKLIHLSKLLNGTGIRQFHKQFPDVAVTAKGDYVVNFVHDLGENYDRFPIYANIPLDLLPEGYRWVPYGLVFRLYREKDVPAYSTVAQKSDFIWHRLHDPLEGSLGTYPNLMLSNIADYYRDAHVRRGLYSANTGKDYAVAYASYRSALRLDPQSGAIRYLLGEVEMARGRCRQAKKFFTDGYKHRTDDRMLYVDSMISLYTSCDKNPALVKKWQKQKSALEQSKEQILQGL